MLPVVLRTTLIIGMFCYFILLLVFLKKKALLLKYALLWIVAGVFLVLMVIFPDLLTWIKEIFGMVSNMNALFVMVLGFVVMILMALTSIASRQAVRIRTLVQTNAILEKRVRDLEKTKSSNNANDMEIY
ncbi:MAG: DUF2304 domain-containing protein [Lachnospiraceae bacterium]|jgi:hypothetical protein|nr:DUF2304 domain-containing protein [Lachnospiraceae bacterium]